MQFLLYICSSISSKIGNRFAERKKKFAENVAFFACCSSKKCENDFNFLQNCRIFGFCFLSIIYFEQKCKILRKSLQNTKKMFAKFAIFALFFVRWKPYLNFYNILCSELSEQGWMGAGCNEYKTLKIYQGLKLTRL